MRYRINDKNGDKLGILGLGCMHFPRDGGRIDQKATEALLEYAIEKGVNYFDTAYIYQGSEKSLGEFLAKGRREKIKLATKMPQMMVKLNTQLDMIFNAQLKRVNTEYIDYYLMHSLSDIGAFEKLIKLGIEDWIEKKKKSGQIINIGFSFHGTENQFKSLVDAYPWDFCQIQYNYIDENNQAGTAGLKYASGKGLPIIVMEPLRGGRLAQVPPDAKAITDKTDYSPAQWGLRWVFDHPEVTVALSGMSSMGQIDENIAAADITSELAAADFAMIEDVKKIINRDIKVQCTGCGYCMPCSSGVDIPACFSSYNDKYVFKLKNAWNPYMRNTNAMSYYPANASRCTNCGACIKRCPQSIYIPGELKRVADELEPSVFKIITKLGRSFTGRKVKNNKAYKK